MPDDDESGSYSIAPPCLHVTSRSLLSPRDACNTRVVWRLHSEKSREAQLPVMKSVISLSRPALTTIAVNLFWKLRPELCQHHFSWKEGGVWGVVVKESQ